MNVDEYMDRFTILETFKASGQKKVFLCEDKTGEFPNPLVIKVAITPSDQLVKRAQREVEIQNKLSSKYYPTNYAFVLLDGKQFGIAEEYIESEPLQSCPHRFDEPLAILNLLDQIVYGLTPLWDLNITHRDLKPENILIKPDNTPVIIDLGIVLAEDKTALTSPFAVFCPCTPSHAAPEQLKNRRANIDHRTDQFVLGLNVMILIGGGVHPFDPDTVGYGDSIPDNIISLNWEEGRLSEDKYLPMRDLVRKMLSPEPHQRFRNAEILRDEISKCARVYQ